MTDWKDVLCLIAIFLAYGTTAVVARRVGARPPAAPATPPFRPATRISLR